MVNNQLIVKDLKSIEKLITLTKSKRNFCIFLHSNHCGPCKLFNNIWEIFMNESKTKPIQFVKIEIGMFPQIQKSATDFYEKVVMKMLIHQNSVPNVAKYISMTDRVYTLKVRDLKNLRQFIKNI